MKKQYVRAGALMVTLLVMPALILGLGAGFGAVQAEEATPATVAAVITVATPDELAAAVDTIIAGLAGTLPDAELTGFKQQLLHDLGAVLAQKGSISIDQAQLEAAAKASATASLPTGQTVKLLRYLAEATASGVDSTELQNLIASGQLDPKELEQALRDLQRQQQEEHQYQEQAQNGDGQDEQDHGQGVKEQDQNRDQNQERDRDRDRDEQHKDKDDGSQGQKGSNSGNGSGSNSGNGSGNGGGKGDD